MLELLFKGLFQWIYELFLELVEYVSNALLDVFSMDMSYFISTVPVATEIMGILRAVGWALLLGNMVFQAVRSMLSGVGFEGEDPKILFTRTFVFSFLLMVSDQICAIGLGMTQAVIGLLQVPSSVTIQMPAETIFNTGAAWLLVLIIGVVVGWQYIKLCIEVGERYVVLAALTVLAPVAFGVGGSQSTSDIFKGWARMFGSMCFMMVSSVIFLKMLISALSYVPVGLDAIPWAILIVAIARVARKMDEIITRIGLNPAITGGGMGRTLPGMLAYTVVRGLTSTVGHTIGKSTGGAKTPPSSSGGGTATAKGRTGPRQTSWGGKHPGKDGLYASSTSPGVQKTRSDNPGPVSNSPKGETPPGEVLSHTASSGSAPGLGPVTNEQTDYAKTSTDNDSSAFGAESGYATQESMGPSSTAGTDQAGHEGASRRSSLFSGGRASYSRHGAGRGIDVDASDFEDADVSPPWAGQAPVGSSTLGGQDSLPRSTRLSNIPGAQMGMAGPIRNFSPKQPTVGMAGQPPKSSSASDPQTGPRTTHPTVGSAGPPASSYPPAYRDPPGNPNPPRIISGVAGPLSAGGSPMVSSTDTRRDQDKAPRPAKGVAGTPLTSSTPPTHCASQKVTSPPSSEIGPAGILPAGTPPPRTLEPSSPTRPMAEPTGTPPSSISPHTLSGTADSDRAHRPATGAAGTDSSEFGGSFQPVTRLAGMSSVCSPRSGPNDTTDPSNSSRLLTGQPGTPPTGGALPTLYDSLEPGRPSRPAAGVAGMPPTGGPAPDRRDTLEPRSTSRPITGPAGTPSADGLPSSHGSSDHGDRSRPTAGATGTVAAVHGVSYMSTSSSMIINQGGGSPIRQETNVRASEPPSSGTPDIGATPPYPDATKLAQMSGGPSTTDPLPNRPPQSGSEGAPSQKAQISPSPHPSGQGIDHLISVAPDPGHAGRSERPQSISAQAAPFPPVTKAPAPSTPPENPVRTATPNVPKPVQSGNKKRKKKSRRGKGGK